MGYRHFWLEFLSVWIHLTSLWKLLHKNVYVCLTGMFFVCFSNHHLAGIFNEFMSMGQYYFFLKLFLKEFIAHFTVDVLLTTHHEIKTFDVPCFEAISYNSFFI